MKLFGLYIGSASNVVTREAYDAMQASYNGVNKIYEQTARNLNQTRTALEETKTELNNALNQLEASKTREAGLETERQDALKQVENLKDTQIGDQQDRLAHNDLLLVVGKAWLNFKNAWQFRKDNPKMNPKERAANNEALDRGIAAVDLNLPKKIEQTSRKAVKDSPPPKAG